VAKTNQGGVDGAQLASRLRALVLRRQDAWLELDLTMPQLRALLVVRQHQPVSMSGVAKALDQRLAAVSALVNRLVRAGLVHREEDPDSRRRVRLRLTDEAERMLTQLDDRAAQRFSAIVARMSPQGREALNAALEELVELFSTEEA
jgi:DNA-binding MarR family transcriptional regulator